MIVSEGYSIYQDTKRNQIVIGLPQSWEAVTQTASVVADREKNLTEQEETLILLLVKTMLTNKQCIDCGKAFSHYEIVT